MNTAPQIRCIENSEATESNCSKKKTAGLHFKRAADWPSLPRQHYCWRLCSMWTVLHPHSADDFLLSALNCSSFFAVSCGFRRRKVGIQVWWHLEVDLTLQRWLGEESAVKYLKVLEEWTLRWSDRFQSLTEKGHLSMRNIVWPRLPTANQRVRRFCSAVARNGLNGYSDPRRPRGVTALNLHNNQAHYCQSRLYEV